MNPRQSSVTLDLDENGMPIVYVLIGFDNRFVDVFADWADADHEVRLRGAQYSVERVAIQ